MPDQQDQGPSPELSPIDEAVRTLTWAHDMAQAIAPVSIAADTATVYQPTLETIAAPDTTGGLGAPRGPAAAEAQAAIAKTIDLLSAIGSVPFSAPDTASVLSAHGLPTDPGSESVLGAIAGTIDVLVTLGDQVPDQESRDAIDRTIDVLVTVGDSGYAALAADTAAVFLPPVIDPFDLPPIDLPPLVAEPAPDPDPARPSRTGLLVAAVLVVVLGIVVTVLVTSGGGDDDPVAVTDTDTDVDASVSTATTAPATTQPVPSTEAAASNRPPTVTELSSSLAVPVTTYTAAATDPDGDTLTYEWSMAGEPCGVPLVPWTLSGQSVSWSHHEDEGCSHESVDHPVTVSLTVSDDRGGSVQCVIHGSSTATYDVGQACLS